MRHTYADKQSPPVEGIFYDEHEIARDKKTRVTGCQTVIPSAVKPGERGGSFPFIGSQRYEQFHLVVQNCHTETLDLHLLKTCCKGSSLP